MNSKLNKNQIKRFSRQIILKNIGPLGQKKIMQSKVLIIGMGGLGCPVAEFLTRAGIGFLGIVDYDFVELSNIHRQSLYDISDIKKSKVEYIYDVNGKTVISKNYLKNEKLASKTTYRNSKKQDVFIYYTNCYNEDCY